MKPCVIWLTGLPSSGKTTLAGELGKAIRPSILLDGDRVREGLCKGLGFSDEGRAENIRRAAEVAVLACESGITPICSFVSPTIAARAAARGIVETWGFRFVEVFLDVPVFVCEARDPKGLWLKARSGLLPGLTGVGSPYERPKNPEILVPWVPLGEAEKLVLHSLELEPEYSI